MLAPRPGPAALLALALVGAAATPVAASTPPAWEHPGYDAEDSHYNPTESTITANNVGELTKKWSVTLREATGPTCNVPPSAPVLSNGRLFVTNNRGIAVHAADTGELGWHQDWEQPDAAGVPSVTVTDGVVAGVSQDCQSMTNQHNRITVWSSDGRLRWTLPLGPASTPIMDDGMLAISADDAGTGYAEVGAYASQTGGKLWTRTAVGAEDVVAGGTILAYKADDDHPEARETLAIALSTGAVRWTKKDISWYAGAASPAGDRFFAIDNNKNFGALDVADGKVLWSRHLEDAEWYAGPSIRWLAVDDERVYRTYDGTIEAIDAGTGKTLWTAKTQTSQDHQPRVAGGLVYTGNVVLTAADGKATGASFPGEVIVAGGRLYQVNDGVLTMYAP